MSALVEGELDRAVQRFIFAVGDERAIREAVGESEPTLPADVARHVREIFDEWRAADAALDEPLARVIRLRDLVRLRLPEAARVTLADLVRELRKRLLFLTTATLFKGERSETPEQFDQHGVDTRRARENLADFLAPLALTMKPPRPLRDLLRRRARRWLRKPRALALRLHARLVARMEAKEAKHAQRGPSNRGPATRGAASPGDATRGA